MADNFKVDIKHLFIQKIITFFLPISFLLTIHSFLNEAFPKIPSFSFLFVLLSVVSVIVSSFICNLVSQEFGKTTSKTRSLFLSMLIIYIILIFFNKNPFPSKIILSPSLFYILFFHFFIWFLNYYFESAFFVWNKFLKIASNKTGEPLYKALRDEDLMMENAEQALNRLRVLSICFLVFLCFIIFISWINKHNFLFRSILTFSLFVFNYIILLSYIKISKNELHFSSLGITSVLKLSFMRIVSVIIILLLCFSFSFLVSPGKPILQKPQNIAFDDSGLIKFLSMFENLFPDNDILFKRMHEETPDALMPTMGDNGATEEDKRNMIAENTDTVDRLDAIFNTIIKMIIVIAIVVFMVLPIFNKKFRAFFKEKKFIKYFKSMIKSIKKFFRNFNFSKDNDDQINVESDKNLYSQFIQKATKKTFSAKKKKEIGELAKVFFKIVEVGEKKDIHLKSSMTPSEYLNMLMIVIDNQKSNLLTIARIFEKSLYSNEELLPEEKEEYKDCYNKFIGSTSTSI